MPRGPLVAAVLCTAVSLAAAQDRKGPDRVTFATVNANYRVAFEEIARRYEALNPGIDVEITVIGQGFETWIRTRFAGGGDLIPDIYNINYTSGYEREGKIAFLDGYLDETNPYTGTRWRDCLDARFIERYKWAGNTYVLSLDYIEIAIFYNKDIFRELGLEVPRTWAGFIGLCESIGEGGYVPMAMPGNFDSFWAGTVGWLVRLFGDAYLRDRVPLIMARPGDWDYEASRNAGYVYDPTGPFSDLFVVKSTERLFNAILDGRLDFRGESFQAMYSKLKEFSRYWQPGFMGSDEASALQLFYRQKAAMYIMTSASVTGIVRDFKKLEPEDRFDYGVFWFPPVTDDPHVCGPFRGCGGSGASLGVTQKHDPAHERNVIDFLMYLTTPESGQTLVDRTLEENQPLTGPSLITGVKMPTELADKFAPFMGNGFEKLNFRGLEDEQESVAEWVAICQEFFGGRLSLDECLRQQQESALAAIPRERRRFGYDLDPRTRDEAPILQVRKSLWNPFENGLLAVAIILAAFTAFAMWHVRRAQGGAKARTVSAYTLLLPGFLLLGVFSYFPALSGLYHAFTEWEEGRAAAFNGLANFRELMGDEAFWRGLGNMAALLIAGLLKATVAPFFAAEMILAVSGNRLRYFFRTAFLLPMVVPGMVGILIWRFIYDPNIGMINQALDAAGLGMLARNWLGEPHLALPSIIFIGFPWIGALGFLIYLAGLMNVPQSVYEAYRIESDSLWRRVFVIDVPLVRGQTRLLVILTFIGSLQDFQSILIMTGGGPGRATSVPALRMYYEAFTFGHFGYGAAIGFVLFAAILAITIVNLRVLKPAEEL